MNEKDMSLFMILEQIGHMSKYQAMKKMEMYDLRPGQAGILFILEKEGKISQKELARKMGITPPSITAALKKLESRGYILKEADERDQRIFRICLSGKGKECTESLRSLVSEVETVLCEGFTDDEKMFMRRMLLEMRNNLMTHKEFQGMDISDVMKKTQPPLDGKQIFKI